MFWSCINTECFIYIRAVILSASWVSYFTNIVTLLKSANLLQSWVWFRCVDLIRSTILSGNGYSGASIGKSCLIFLACLYLTRWAADSCREAFCTVRSQVWAHHLHWLSCSPLPCALISLLHQHNSLWVSQWYGTFYLNFTNKHL